MPDHSIVTIDSAAGLPELQEALRDADLFGVDTESNSLHAYREQVCFVQIAVGDRVFLIDTLAVRDLSGLSEPFEDPDVVKILHGADYDVSCLGRDYGFRIRGLFDTMIAAQLLGRERLGLGGLVESHFGVVLDKSLTRHDWGHRPLEARYFKYLADDVIYLERLFDALSDDLHEADIEEEAEIEFERVSNMPFGRKEPDPEAFRNVKGASTLGQTELSVLRELYLLRESLSERSNRPPFKVLANQMLLAAARTTPRSRSDLQQLPGFTPRVMHRHGQAVMVAVHRGLKNKENVPLRNPNRKPPMPKEQAAVVDGLKEWRKKKVQEEDRSGTLILPNHVLDRLAEERPRTLDALADFENLGTRRFERYGKEILNVILNPPPSDRWRKFRR